MSDRKSRRAVMAELLLLANPTDIAVRASEGSLSATFDSFADLKSWLHLAGLSDQDALLSEHQGVRGDGRPYRMMYAFPTWHGWQCYAYATEYTDSDAALDSATADGLTALAVAE